MHKTKCINNKEDCKHLLPYDDKLKINHLDTKNVLTLYLTRFHFVTKKVKKDCIMANTRVAMLYGTTILWLRCVVGY